MKMFILNSQRLFKESIHNRNKHESNVPILSQQWGKIIRKTEKKYAIIEQRMQFSPLIKIIYCNNLSRTERTDIRRTVLQYFKQRSGRHTYALSTLVLEQQRGFGANLPSFPLTTCWHSYQSCSGTRKKHPVSGKSNQMLCWAQNMLQTLMDFFFFPPSLPLPLWLSRKGMFFYETALLFYMKKLK